MKVSSYLIAIICAPALLAVAGQANAGTSETNKALVIEFYKALDDSLSHGISKDGIRQIAEQFLTPDYKQHSVNAKSTGHGRDDFINELSEIPQTPPPPGAQSAPPPPPVRLALLADEDEVILVTRRSMTPPGAAGPQDTIVFNLFRVRDGKLAEHWDAFGALPDTHDGTIPPSP